jgi:hypothetical protein
MASGVVSVDRELDRQINKHALLRGEVITLVLPCIAAVTG